MEGITSGYDSQLLMRWDVQPVDVPVAPQGYTLHQHRRGGSAALSEAAFKAGWLRTVYQDKPRDDQAFEQFYTDQRMPDDGFFVVLDSTGQVVSTTSVQLGVRTPDSATLHMVYADAEHRGKGLGKLVFLAAMRYVYERGIKTAYLTTDDFRLTAIQMYLKRGFVPVMYKPGMRARWLALFKQLGINEAYIIDEHGERVLFVMPT